MRAVTLAYDTALRFASTFLCSGLPDEARDREWNAELVVLDCGLNGHMKWGGSNICVVWRKVETWA